MPSIATTSRSSNPLPEYGRSVAGVRLGLSVNPAMLAYAWVEFASRPRVADLVFADAPRSA